MIGACDTAATLNDPVAASPAGATQAPDAHATADGSSAHEGQTTHPSGKGDAEAAHGRHGCHALGVDGLAPACTFMARCNVGELFVTCDEASGTCTCRGPEEAGTKQVAYDPAFCANGVESPWANLDAATRACGWVH